MKNMLSRIIVLLYILASLVIVSNLVMIVMKFGEIEPISSYIDSMSLFFKIRSISLGCLLFISAYSISKKKLFGIRAIVIYLLLAVIPRIVLQVKLQEFGLDYLISYMQYFIIFLIYLYLTHLKRNEYFH